MDEHSIRHLRGTVELFSETFAATVEAVAATQQTIADQHYKVLNACEPIAESVSIVEQIQRTFSDWVYHSLRFSNELAGAAMIEALDRCQPTTEGDLLNLDNEF